ncbi:cation diffusion facilitator family transporter [Promicromonospora iranensis]|uniref:Cation diffusion facilitator family transporter n=1 Tax=Promicromonospora iranensis TaxID=1105144 RepID=A0ABU2CPY2_9MICO|nr:cation transporter [Promicromonospora iranensis]MDR7383410.1 cation diffusion facilitator family transporter [Promicromonospora iranensis]
MARDRGGSGLTVVIAFTANFAVATAKTVAAVLTGSASMVAEAAHSWADTGNEVFLLVAERKSGRAPDTDRPLGYGREAYVWSMLAALGLFVAGGVVSVYHGIREFGAAGETGSYTVGYIVLAVAFCLEGVSFVQAYRRTRAEARALGRDLLDHALATSDPTLRAVLAEDAAALVGLVIAAGSMALHQVTGDGRYDAVGSILVGVLLCVVAVVLFDRNRRFLTGEVADERIHQAVRARVEALPGVQRVGHLRLEFVGPRQILLVASIDLPGDESESHVAVRLRDLEQQLERVPQIVDAVLTPAVPSDR